MKHDITFYAGVGNSVSQSLSSCSDNRWVIRFISHIGSNFGAEDSGFRLVGLGVWFSLRVREVPGSNPGRALHYLFQTRLSKASTKATTIKHTQVLQLLHSSCSWKTDDFRMPYMSYKVNCPDHLYTTLAALPHTAPIDLLEKASSRFYIYYCKLIGRWLVGLGVWFSLWVREVPGSNPGRAHHFWLWNFSIKLSLGDICHKLIAEMQETLISSFRVFLLHLFILSVISKYFWTWKWSDCVLSTGHKNVHIGLVRDLNPR